MRERFESFCKALERLKESLQAESTELNRDAAIQRFEFTYELAWKVMKDLLFKDGLECNTPRDCIKGAFKAKYLRLEDEQKWIRMIDDRNLSSHIYNENIAKEIYDRIKKDHSNLLIGFKQEIEWKY